MRTLHRSLILLLGVVVAARADVIRLRDGTSLVGRYVGGTRTEIWFQSNPQGAQAYPLFLVDSVKFGPAAFPEIGRNAPRGVQRPLKQSRETASDFARLASMFARIRSFACREKIARAKMTAGPVPPDEVRGELPRLFTVLIADGLLAFLSAGYFWTVARKSRRRIISRTRSLPEATRPPSG
jgi:hypothetical protein